MRRVARFRAPPHPAFLQAVEAGSNRETRFVGTSSRSHCRTISASCAAIPASGVCIASRSRPSSWRSLTPPFITGYAADEWYRVAPELHGLRLFTLVDSMPLAAYCSAYGHRRTAEETLAGMAANDPVMSGLLVKSVDGSARRNPLIKIAADAASEMIRYAGEFGLTPVARSRLAAGVGSLSDAGFSGLLGGSDAFRS